MLFWTSCSGSVWVGGVLDAVGRFRASRPDGCGMLQLHFVHSMTKMDDRGRHTQKRTQNCYFLAAAPLCDVQWSIIWSIRRIRDRHFCLRATPTIHIIAAELLKFSQFQQENMDCYLSRGLVFFVLIQTLDGHKKPRKICAAHMHKFAINIRGGV